MPPNTLRVRKEYVLIKNSGSESLVRLNHKCRGLENISLPTVPCLNCGDEDRWCRHLSSLRGISPIQFVLSPVWCSRPRAPTGVLLPLATMNFDGFVLTTSDRLY
ncbi:uncharacterized protein TNCV_4475291 [Trichonephila clavipes]|nr:uncharacterized protein TNCV_4475291 [Trichonephila clavipes]